MGLDNCSRLSIRYNVIGTLPISTSKLCMLYHNALSKSCTALHRGHLLHICSQLLRQLW